MPLWAAALPSSTSSCKLSRVKGFYVSGVLRRFLRAPVAFNVAGYIYIFFLCKVPAIFFEVLVLMPFGIYVFLCIHASRSGLSFGDTPVLVIPPRT